MPRTRQQYVLIYMEGAYYDPATGEMLVPHNDGRGGLIRTGYTFVQPIQSLPRAEAPDGPRYPVALSPWGFATAKTAEEVRVMLAGVVPVDVELTIQDGERNAHFPISERPLEIRARSKESGRKVRLN